MFSTTDTIVAIATPPGRGGIGVVRLSGPEAHRISLSLLAHPHALKPRYATLTTVRSKGDGTCGHAPVRLKADPTYGADPAQDVSSTHGGDPMSRADAANTSAPARTTTALEVPPSATGAASAIDQVVATYFAAPHSYTGDDVVEISAHGSPVVLREIVEAAMASGARLAEPGEFTLRSFLNGRIDLTQAEAVGDLIDAATPLQARAAFDQLQGTLTQIIGDIDRELFDLIARLEASVDFPDEGYHFVDANTLASAVDGIIARTERLLTDGTRGRIVREGLQVAIVGKPNVGKSSVFNALVGVSRAIVTEVPGTTRDLLTEVVDLDGLRVTIVDTAGIRHTSDIVETEGVRRALDARTVSDLLLVVLDGSLPLDEQDREILFDTSQRKRVVVQNKSDLGLVWGDPEALRVSATTFDGISQLRAAMCAALDVEPLRDRPEITNVRHIALVRSAHEAMRRARRAAKGEQGSLPEEFVLADLQDARTALEEISGRRVSDDLLAHIFSRFCIGK